ncbi:ACP phosphodiesterase [Oceanihabitans sediminis]|uniref:DUF479 domain-containing protein n=1 Tax=Oceanihabitans sediminis TaxID=1812012 RepID=A0A368P0Z9_9FLAO|nr:acyl carrier protein phosphodiesterase [Oceanihabitans sediminis]MDX1277697.1 acyl carrier protein phosphodiesterase [Oceanihabitans sediminis]MDX1774453.1 acyl carrier protein phosphodiesterase [Oceanihabitans sediminis]RBP27739.1 acyl carrier protein phosphodiesterase [Oceanihabitans sediminis]RCU56527.1 DUF479 domain-containing protein [Oceanihabitans sediminis]
MNFLAHIYLSGNNEMLSIGNFIADAIRGNKYDTYPEEIQTGVLLHRQIDSFTDAHKTFRKSTKKLHKNYSHYAGVIVDIIYDHFLAKNWSKYSDIPLEVFAENFYQLLQDNFDLLPSKTQKMLPYLTTQNWLVSYATIEGITEVLEGMNRRTKSRSKMNLAVNELQEHYEEFEAEFTSFFEELITFSNEKLKELQSQK